MFRPILDLPFKNRAKEPVLPNIGIKMGEQSQQGGSAPKALE